MPNFIYLETVDSTNNYAVNLLKTSDVENGTTIITKKQSSGKGQRGNLWESEDDRNLILSLILFPQLKIKDAFYLTIASSLAVHKTLSHHLNSVKIKWPNDILIQRRKIAGILIENNLRGSLISSSIVGIGINLNQLQFDMDFETPATSLRIESGKRYLPETEAKLLFSCVWSDYQSLLNGNKEEINTNYREHLFGLGSISSFKNTNESFKGSLLDVNDEGAAILEVDGKVIQVKHPNTRIVV